MLNLTTVEECGLAIAPVDATGAAAPVQNVVWTNSDNTIATVTPNKTLDANNNLVDADELHAVVSAVAVGTTRVTVTADADMGDGVNNITASLDVTVGAAQAVAFTINTGTPAVKPAAPPVTPAVLDPNAPPATT